MSAYLLDVDALYYRLDTRRIVHGLTWRQVASRLELSPSTFSRMSAGKRPDADALVSILFWLGIDASQVTKPKEDT